jgi:uncharacterized protein YgiM (DUF1202 family)
MSTNQFKPGQKCRVTLAHETVYDDPLIIKAGEMVAVGRNDTRWPSWVWCTTQIGKSGWIPENYLDRTNSQATARRDYDATELSANLGEEVVVGYEESGWIWCTNRQGHSGWLPADNVTEV